MHVQVSEQEDVILGDGIFESAALLFIIAVLMDAKGETGHLHIQILVDSLHLQPSHRRIPAQCVEVSVDNDEVHSLPLEKSVDRSISH